MISLCSIGSFKSNAGIAIVILFCFFSGCSKAGQESCEPENVSSFVYYCVQMPQKSFVHQSKINIPVMARDRQGETYAGSIVFEGDFGAGYLNTSLNNDSLFIQVRRSLDIGFIGTDLNGKKYQIFTQISN